MNDGVKEFGVVGLDTYTWGIKDFHKCWSRSLAKRRLCLGLATVTNCTPLSALSFLVSLFPGRCGYNKNIQWAVMTQLVFCSLGITAFKLILFKKCVVVTMKTSSL